MLRSETEAQFCLDSAGLSRAYVDPSFNSPKVYSKFLHELSSRKLIDFKIGCSKSYLGVFSCAKRTEN